MLLAPRPLLPGRWSPLCDEELALSWFLLPQYYWSTLRVEEVAEISIIPKSQFMVYLKQSGCLSYYALKPNKGCIAEVGSHFLAWPSGGGEAVG